MKPTILARLEKIYRSMPAEITDDNEIMRQIAIKILAESPKRKPDPLDVYSRLRIPKL